MMFDLRKNPMLRVFVPTSAGIYAGLHPGTSMEMSLVSVLLSGFTLMALIIFLRNRRRPPARPWCNTLLLFLVFFLAGVGSGIQTRPRDPGLPVDRWILVRGELSGPAHPGDYGYVFDMKSQLIGTADSTYRIKTTLRCYLPPQAGSLLPAAGEAWQFSGRLAGVRSSGNPGMPDYRAILGRKNCWYRFYVSSSTLGSGYHRRMEAAERKFNAARIRRLVSRHWKGDETELSLLKAVCLGDRSSLSDDLRQAYAYAGGMHLLAVSGLHVGLIWWVLQHLTGWMSLVFRKGIVQNLLVVLLLWFYAFITGFSSSVCRSVTMFSFFSAGRIRGERSRALNTILASAFLLVIIEPTRLMDAGFQLSYAAITGIVTLHPVIKGTIRTRYRVIRWIIEAVSVSFSAQIATAPLVIYYFNQLPLYSLITSLAAIPLLSALIAIFVCSVPFSAAGLLENLSSFLLVRAARVMNLSVEYISALPGAVLDELQLGLTGLLLWLVLLLLLALTLHRPKLLYYQMILTVVACWLAWHSLSSMKQRSGSELVIAHIRGASHVSIRQGSKVDHYCWYRDSSSVSYADAFRSRVWNKRKYGNRIFEVGSLQRTSGSVSYCIGLKDGLWLLGAGDLRGLVIGAAGSGDLSALLNQDQNTGFRFRPDFILLNGEPAQDELIRAGILGEVMLVIDGSNSSRYKEKLEAESDHIYLTDLAGAYVKTW